MKAIMKINPCEINRSRCLRNFILAKIHPLKLCNLDQYKSLASQKMLWPIVILSPVYCLFFSRYKLEVQMNRWQRLFIVMNVATDGRWVAMILFRQHWGRDFSEYFQPNWLKILWKIFPPHWWFWVLNGLLSFKKLTVTQIMLVCYLCKKTFRKMCSFYEMWHSPCSLQHWWTLRSDTSCSFY